MDILELFQKVNDTEHDWHWYFEDGKYYVVQATPVYFDQYPEQMGGELIEKEDGFYTIDDVPMRVKETILETKNKESALFCAAAYSYIKYRRFYLEGDIDRLMGRVIINFMNDMTHLDSDAIKKLVKTRVQCNERMAEHPTLQVMQGEDNKYYVGLMGILNGIVGCDEQGRGIVAWCINDKGDFYFSELMR
jgi:hypothetical protein